MEFYLLSPGFLRLDDLLFTLSHLSHHLEDKALASTSPTQEQRLV